MVKYFLQRKSLRNYRPLLQKFLHKSLLSNNSDFVRIMFEHNPSLFEFEKKDWEEFNSSNYNSRLNPNGFFESLYDSNKINLRLSEKFCKTESSALSCLLYTHQKVVMGGAKVHILGILFIDKVSQRT